MLTIAARRIIAVMEGKKVTEVFSFLNPEGDSIGSKLYFVAITPDSESPITIRECTDPRPAFIGFAFVDKCPKSAHFVWCKIRNWFILSSSHVASLKGNAVLAVQAF